MKDYVEDYKYNNCFWKKSGVLYEHSDSKFREYMSVGYIFQKMSNEIYRLSEFLGKLNKVYEKPKEPNYTREDGIQVVLSTIKMVKNEFNKLAVNLGEIARKILEKKDTYESKIEPMKMCDEAFKKYDNELNKLSSVKKSYLGYITFLIVKYSVTGGIYLNEVNN